MFEGVQIGVGAVEAGIEVGAEALLSETGKEIFSLPVLEVDLVRAGEIVKLIEAGTSHPMPTETSASNAESMIDRSTEILAAGIMISGRETIRLVAVVPGTEHPLQEHYRP